MVLMLSQGHEDSEYVLSLEIGQREGGFYSGRTSGQNHSVPYSNIDINIKIVIFIYQLVIVFYFYGKDPNL